MKEIVGNSTSNLALFSALRPPNTTSTLDLWTNGSKTDKFIISRGLKAYSSCWLEFLGLPFQAPVYESILEILDDKVLPNLKEPTLLMDFYVDAYNSGSFS